MKLIKRGKTWYVDFVNIDGQRQRLSTGQTEERLAKIRGVELMSANMSGQLTDSERKEAGTYFTLGMALTKTFQNRWSVQANAAKVRMNILQIARDIGHHPVHRITWGFLQDYRKQLADERGNGPTTCNHKMSYIATALKDCVKDGLLQACPPIPFVKVDNIKERYMTTAEEAQVLAWFAANTAPADTARQYMADLFVVLIDTGFRCSEALGLTRDRVHGGMAILPHGKSSSADPRTRTKSGRGRSVPLTRRAAEALERVLASPHHGNVESIWVGDRWRRIMAQVGIEDVTVHTLRHTCASRLVQRGVDLYVVAKWLGHSSTKITERYAHLTASNLTGALSVLEQPTGAVDISEPLIIPRAVAHVPGTGTVQPENVH